MAQNAQRPDHQRSYELVIELGAKKRQVIWPNFLFPGRDENILLSTEQSGEQKRELSVQTD